MIFRVDKDCVVGTSRHAGLAANANRFIKINYSVRPLEHCCRGAGGDTWRMRALITTRHLVRAARLRENTHVDMLDVSSRHADRDYVFRLASSRAGMTSDTAGMVDDLGPLHALFANWFCCTH
jgi:hypothetical protein